MNDILLPVNLSIVKISKCLNYKERELFYQCAKNVSAKCINYCNKDDEERHLLGVGIIEARMLELEGKLGKWYYEKYGKPRIDSNYFFNISHSGNYVVCVDSIVENGVDIEQISSVKYDIVERCFSNEEINYIKKYNEPDSFYTIWTGKESYLKALGIGLNDRLKKISLIDYKMNRVKRIGKYKLKYLDVLEKYKITVCVESELELNVKISLYSKEDIIRIIENGM